MLFDTHAHLNDPKFDEDREAALARAKDAGVARVVEIADAPEDWDKALRLSRARPEQVRCALGLHPYYADRFSESLGARLARLAALPEVVAAGEIGLDYAKCSIPPAVQRESFVRMLEAAAAAGLPVVVHCRDAYADLLPILDERYGGRRPEGRFHGVVHCFSGTEAEARRAVELGFALGVDGPVTYPKNDALRAALAAAGLESLVLETDSPYLPPQSSRGKRNEPANLGEIAGRLAELFKVPASTVAEATTANALALYRLGAS